MRIKALFGAFVFAALATSSVSAQDRGYPISKKDGPLHKAEVVAVLKTPGACSSAAWKDMFNVTCQQLLDMFRTVDPSSSLTQVSQLLSYIDEQLTEKKCPVGIAQVATLRRGPNTKGVIDYNYRREFGRDEFCLYNRNNSASGKPVVPIDCWNGVKGYRTSEELAKPETKVVEVVRATMDTLRLSVGTSVIANGIGAMEDGDVVSVKDYGYLRLVDLRLPAPAAKTDTVTAPAVTQPQSVFKSKKFWGGAILGSVLGGLVGHYIGQRNVKCLACKK